MKIKVLKHFKFAEDGITVKTYELGIHEVSKHVADIAIHEGWAKKPVVKKKAHKKVKS